MPPPTHTVVMKGKISDIDQNHFLYQTVNILFSAVKLGILTWGGGGRTDSLLQPDDESVSVTSVLVSREVASWSRRWQSTNAWTPPTVSSSQSDNSLTSLTNHSTFSLYQ